MFLILVAFGCDSHTMSPSRLLHTEDAVTFQLDDGQQLSVRTWVFSPAPALSKVAANVVKNNQEAIQRLEARLAGNLEDDLRRDYQQELDERQRGEWGFTAYDDTSRTIMIPMFGSDDSRDWLVIVGIRDHYDIVFAVHGTSRTGIVTMRGIIDPCIEALKSSDGTYLQGRKVLNEPYVDDSGDMVYKGIIAYFGDRPFPEQD